VLARGSVEAFVGEPQAVDWFAADDVRLDDFFDVGLGDVSIPDGFGIDHKIRAVLALVETAGLVGPYFPLKAAFGQFLLEYFLELRLACGIAASSGTSRWTLVAADEDVFFEPWHCASKPSAQRAQVNTK